MEFHISRTIREKLDVAGLLFGYTGNVVFADVAASRRLAARLNDALGPDPDPSKIINAGALFAMGMIDELNHALVARYREDVDPGLLTDAIGWFAAQVGPAEVERLLLAFAEQFPNVAIYRKQLTAAEWLKGTTDGLSNREAAFEELMLLWLTNINPAFTGFKQLFDDTNLKGQTTYANITVSLPDYLNSRPSFSEAGSLYEALSAPMLASPDSITGQLDFIREHWPKFLGEELSRVLLAIDILREEDVAIWMRFHPPGPDRHRHGAPGFGGEGFIGDEYIGFERDFGGEFIVGTDGVRRRRYATDYQAPLVEYEAFSADQAWMPNVVLMAKSTYVWFEQLSKKYGRHIHHLNHIPDEELQLLATRGITGLWLIGLWERSISSRTIKRLRGQGDAVASAYSLKEYNIAEDLGGPHAYENLRDRAAAHGIRLASDMVPNHMGIDSPWVIEHPEWFISRDESPFPVYKFDGPDISPDSRVEIKIEDHYYDQTDAAVVFRLRHHYNGQTRYVYHGNDGTSFAWNDTAQLDYSKQHVREHVIQTILHVARQFPIIRFDAAMVLAKRHVQRLWFPLPGAGGSIPSRAENAISEEQFESLMPNEFWREVVDRVAAEVPGTLLLAEAFWLLEGYFVRTLGMHRVYNSAFMNMLRDEENAKYRSYLKKTIEFDPDIMKRYVNFMSNPDERTAIDQFGSGDKFFGVCTLLATLPGLPMFGHGQIEGFTERYGMEYKTAKMDENPNEGLVARHQRDIAPLLRNRWLFAESTHFVLYDFWNDHGTVDENVFVFSNRAYDQRAVIFYNNRYGSTRGSIHLSAASMDKASGELQQRSLSQGLGLSRDHSIVVAYRDIASGLEYLRRASDFNSNGMGMELRGYQYVVLLNWREFRSTAEMPWDRLCDALGGRGVHSVDEALLKLRLRPMHEALSQTVNFGTAQLFAEVAAESSAASRKPKIDKPSTSPLQPQASKQSTAQSELDEPGELGQPAESVETEESAKPTNDNPVAPVNPRLTPFLHKSLFFFDRVMENYANEIFATLRERQDIAQSLAKPAAGSETDEHPLTWEDAKQRFSTACKSLSEDAIHLPQLARLYSTAWPPAVRYTLPSNDPGVQLGQTWAPVLAWLTLQAIPVHGKAAKLFDDLHFRDALAEVFASLGMDDYAKWRAAAGVRILLALGDDPAKAIDTDAFWDSPDVRWLAGVNDSSGVTYFNKEQFEELVCWLQLPALLQIETSSPDAAASMRKLEDSVSRACKEAKSSGYNLYLFLRRMKAVQIRVNTGAS